MIYSNFYHGEGVRLNYKKPLDIRKELLKRTQEKRKKNINKQFVSFSSLNIDIPAEAYEEYKKSKGRDYIDEY